MKHTPLRLGAYVWYGFSRPGAHYTERLLSEFTGREPIWGWTEDSLENMEYQIDIAADYGLSFFAFDWYYGVPRLNEAVDKYLASANRHKVSFCLMVANHEGARIKRDRWEDACTYFVKYMANDCAVRADGKPIIIFYDLNNTIEDLGGPEAVKECFDDLRKKMEPYGGAYIMGCECPYGTPATGAIDYNFEAFTPEALKVRLDRIKRCGFDALTGYNYRRYSPINGSYELTYQTMVDQHEDSWEAMAQYSDMKYAPCILSGWDCRPYECDWNPHLKGVRSCYAPDRTSEVFAQHIRNAAAWLDRNPAQDPDGLALIYAWDEVNEGGFLIPTKGEGFSMLEGMKKALSELTD